MSNFENREQLIEFCIKARAEIEGVATDDDKEMFTKMSEWELEEEANWLDDMLEK